MRYSNRPFPAYAFIPGQLPHPRTHPAGHSYGMESAAPPPIAPDKWADSDAWLYGVDLYNHDFHWEAHEAWEGIWLHASADERGDARLARFLQGLIQVAAGFLKRKMGEKRGASRLLAEGLEKLRDAPDRYLGVAVREFEAGVADALATGGPEPPLVLAAAD